MTRAPTGGFLMARPPMAFSSLTPKTNDDPTITFSLEVWRVWVQSDDTAMRCQREDGFFVMPKGPGVLPLLLPTDGSAWLLRQ
jgi:hypothetical protein